MFPFLNRLLLVSCLLVPMPGLAREGGQGGDAGMMGGGGSGAGLSSAVTKQVVKTLKRAGRECGSLEKVYQYDCYRWAYKLAADALVGRSAYKEAYEALAKVERVLKQEVDRNADPAKPPLRRAFNTYSAVKPAAVPKVQSKAVAALDEAETVLLRSSTDKRNHYTDIAAAVNSNKVLLRSALLLVPGLNVILVLLA